MTKLMEWIIVIASFFCIWAVLLANISENIYVLYMPVILLGALGIYAVSTVLYRTFTFNNCQEAASSLQKEILAAKEDLTRLGFKFNEQ